MQKQSDPIARLCVFTLAALVLMAFLVVPQPTVESTPWPDMLDPIGALQYACYGLAILVIVIHGLLGHRIDRLVSRIAELETRYREHDVRLAIGRAQRYTIFKRDHFCCQLCGRTSGEGVVLEVDHKVPRSKGGTDDESNLWTLCWECNSGKSNQYL